MSTISLLPLNERAPQKTNETRVLLKTLTINLKYYNMITVIKAKTYPGNSQLSSNSNNLQ